MNKKVKSNIYVLWSQPDELAKKLGEVLQPQATRVSIMEEANGGYNLGFVIRLSKWTKTPSVIDTMVVLFKIGQLFVYQDFVWRAEFKLYAAVKVLLISPR